MSERSGVTTGISCARADRIFEERLLEGVVSAEARLDFESHLKACERCRSLHKRILRMQQCADELSEAEVEAAARRSVLQRAAISPREEGRAKWAIAAAAGIVVAVVATAAVVALLRSSGEVTPISGTVGCRPSAVFAPAPGIRTVYCGPSEPDIVSASDGTVRVELKTGTVGLDVDPKRPNPKAVIVDTASGEVRVKGTLFTVRGGPDPRVEVFRGAVEFLPAAGGKSIAISERQGANLLSGTLFERSSFQTAVLGRALDRAAVPEGPALPRPGVISQSPAVESPVESVSPHPEATDTNPPVGAAATSHFQTGSESVKRSSTADRLIQQAQTCLIDRDWSCAAAKYDEVLQRFRGRPESAAVLVSLARLELHVLHEPEKALRHYTAYGRQAPNGVLAEEAMYGIAAVYRTKKDSASEKAALHRFIARYPQSTRLAQAEARLRRLEGTVLPEAPTTEP